MRKYLPLWSPKSIADLASSDPRLRILRLAGFGGGADPGEQLPKRHASPIAAIAHEKVIRPQWARWSQCRLQVRGRIAAIEFRCQVSVRLYIIDGGIQPEKKG